MGDLLISGGEEHDVGRVRVSSSCPETFSREGGKKNPRLNHSQCLLQLLLIKICTANSDIFPNQTEPLLSCFVSDLVWKLTNNVCFSHTVAVISLMCLLWRYCMLWLLCRDELCSEALIKTGVDQKVERIGGCFCDQSELVILIHIWRVRLARRQKPSTGWFYLWALLVVWAVSRRQERTGNVIWFEPRSWQMSHKYIQY